MSKFSQQSIQNLNDDQSFNDASSRQESQVGGYIQSANRFGFQSNMRDQLSVNSSQQRPSESNLNETELKIPQESQQNLQNQQGQQKTMQQQIKELKEQQLKQGDTAIIRAQQLMDQIQKQVQKKGIGADDDERQKQAREYLKLKQIQMFQIKRHYQSLIRQKREYEEEYLKKTKEFYMTEGMNMDKMQNFIIENFEMSLQQQRAKLDEEIKEKEDLLQQQFNQNRKLFEQRLPQVSDIRAHFYKQSKEIFRPLKQLEIRNFYQEIKEKQKTFDVQEYMESRAFEKLEETYYKTYFEWSMQQPGVEDQRNFLKEQFVECFELASTLNNQPESLDKPLIWHSLQFTENEKKYVDEWMRKKNLIKTNKYGFLEDDQEYEADEILKKTDKYLDTDLFIQQDYNEEDQYSDDEKGQLKKIQERKEPYNENTIDNYDNEEDEQDQQQSKK